MELEKVYIVKYHKMEEVPEELMDEVSDIKSYEHNDIAVYGNFYSANISAKGWFEDNKYYVTRKYINNYDPKDVKFEIDEENGIYKCWNSTYYKDTLISAIVEEKRIWF